MEERAKLHKADLYEIFDFFLRVIKNIKEDITDGVTWEGLIKIPDLEDQINITEKAINEDITEYKETILEIQKEKDAIINLHKKELDKMKKNLL